MKTCNVAGTPYVVSQGKHNTVCIRDDAAQTIARWFDSESQFKEWLRYR
jgi:hypothetical protein